MCDLAGKFIKHLKERSLKEECTEEQVLCVRLAALCHDLGELSEKLLSFFKF